MLLIALAVLACGITSLWPRARWGTQRELPALQWIDVLLVVLLMAIGSAMASGIVNHLNPRWLPGGPRSTPYVWLSLWQTKLLRNCFIIFP